jgi:fluoroacetyl-CoA thioesterase
MFPQIHAGLIGEREIQVEEEQTARHLGSGNVSVLATPEMIRLMEQAAVQAVDPLLPEGYSTVGIHVHVNHLAATPLGMRVRVRAELQEVDGRKLTFRVQAFDEIEPVGEGTHQRMIVDLARFKQRLEAKRTRQ